MDEKTCLQGLQLTKYGSSTSFKVVEQVNRTKAAQLRTNQTCTQLPRPSENGLDRMGQHHKIRSHHAQETDPMSCNILRIIYQGFANSQQMYATLSVCHTAQNCEHFEVAVDRNDELE